VREAEEGTEVSIAIEGLTIGRQADVGDLLYVDLPERHVKVLEKEMLSHLTAGAQAVLEEFTSMKRKNEPFWGK